MAVAHLVLAVAHDLREGNLRLRAAALTYATLLSLAPLLAICFSVLKGIGLHNQLEPFLLDFLSPLGEQGRDIARKIVGFVDNIKVGVLGTAGFVALMYGVIAMMREIELAFNDIWRVKRTRSLTQRIRDYLSVLFIGPLSMALSVAMTEAFRHANLAEKWLGIVIPGGVFETAAAFMPYALFMFAFTALYMFMPNTPVKLVPALAAGFVATVLWKILGWLFGIFVVGSGSYAAIYSIFAAMMMFMIWVYTGWLVVLIGASLAYYVQHPSNQRIPRRFKHMSMRVREKTALMLCGEIGRGFYAGETPPVLSALAKKLELPALIVGEVAEALIKVGILATTGKAARQYMPGCPFDMVSVDEMLKRLRAADEADGIAFDQVKSSGAIEGILNSIDTIARRELGKITLKQIASGEDNE